MAKVSAEGGPTLYVAEGDPVPDDVAEGVRLVGPGAPAGDEAGATEAEKVAAAALVTVAEQRAAGVPPEETVTIADQKAGVEPPIQPDKVSSPTYPKPV